MKIPRTHRLSELETKLLHIVQRELLELPLLQQRVLRAEFEKAVNKQHKRLLGVKP